MDNEVMMVRIYLRESDHGRRRTLMKEILNVLHDRQRVQEVIVLRGIAGFDESGEVHAADLLRLNVDLPLIIEFFDTPSVAQAAIALLDEIVPTGHILSWRAVQHRNGAPAKRGA